LIVEVRLSGRLDLSYKVQNYEWTRLAFASLEDAHACPTHRAPRARRDATSATREIACFIEDFRSVVRELGSDARTCYAAGMTDLKGPLVREVTEDQVRAKLLKLASVFADRAESSTDAAEAQTYAESAAVVFSAAQGRMNDVPPDRG
jgi:hypothetical protein